MYYKRNVSRIKPYCFNHLPKEISQSKCYSWTLCWDKVSLCLLVFMLSSTKQHPRNSEVLNMFGPRAAGPCISAALNTLNTTQSATRTIYIYTLLRTYNHDCQISGTKHRQNISHSLRYERMVICVCSIVMVKNIHKRQIETHGFPNWSRPTASLPFCRCSACSRTNQPDYCMLVRFFYNLYWK